MKIKRRKVLTNGYTSKKRRREVLGFRMPSLGAEEWYSNRADPYTCKCGRSIYDHPCLSVGCHYTSMPYHGDLCPFLMIKE